MSQNEIEKLRTACNIANARTEEKIKANLKKQERAQLITFICMLALSTVYVGR